MSKDNKKNIDTRLENLNRRQKVMAFFRNFRKNFKHFLRKVTKRDFLVKVVIVFCTVVLLATSILPYIL